MMEGSPIEEIKNRLDIVEVISQYVKLKKTGANWSAVCPFHSEKSGSFFVSQTKQIWRCFGCGKGGDVFTFVEMIEGVEFGDALRILAAKAGVELKRQEKQNDEMKTERQRFYDACELAARFFEKQIAASPMGQEAQKYLAGRGLAKEDVLAWRIGWAPDSWQGLADFLHKEGYIDSEIVGAGLAINRNGGGIYDRFRGRIMFPIFDFNFQVVGFGGRIFKLALAQGCGKAKQDNSEIKESKYMNTPATLLYDKSRILYGLDRAKVAIRKKNACILVEGYTDVIMSAKIGADNVVSSSGTALTQFQLKILKRFTNNLVLGYDMDLAGDTANSRGIELALAEGFNVSVARPEYEDKDPADVILTDPEAWKKAVENTKTIMEFYFERAFYGKDIRKPDVKKEVALLLLPQIKRINNIIEQSFWLQKLSHDLGVREDDLREELKKVKLNQYPVNAERPASVAAVKPRRQGLEEGLLVLAIKFPKLAKLLDEKIMAFVSEEAREIFSLLKAGRDFSDKASAAVKELYNALYMKAETEVIEENSATEDFILRITEVRKLLLNEASKKKIEAERAGDEAEIKKWTDEWLSLSKLIHNL